MNSARHTQRIDSFLPAVRLDRRMSFVPTLLVYLAPLRSGSAAWLRWLLGP
jgi:hypothetical protein